MIAEIGVEKCSVSFDRLYSYTVPDRLSDALDHALEKCGRDATVLAMPFGGSTLPTVAVKQES